MLPYRIRSDGDSVHIVVARSTFWMRFLANWRRSRGLLAVTAGIGTVLALGITSIGLIVDASSDVAESTPWSLLGTIFLGVWLIFGGFPLIVRMIRLIGTSLEPSRLEQALPSAITMREEGLVVTERSGESRSVKWSWFAGARDLGDALELSLAHDKPMTLLLRQGDGINVVRVRRWLAAHQLLR